MRGGGRERERRSNRLFFVFLYRLIPLHVIESVKKLLSWFQDRLSLNTCDNDDLLLVSQCVITALAIDPELINTALPQLVV